MMKTYAASSETFDPQEQPDRAKEGTVPYGAELFRDTDIPQIAGGLACVLSPESGSIDDAEVLPPYDVMGYYFPTAPPPLQ